MHELRDHLPKYLTTSFPIAVTHHENTIGFYIPTCHNHKDMELNALKKSASKLEALLTSQNITEEELVAEFQGEQGIAYQILQFPFQHHLGLH